ncbi:MAG: hypothetical protein KC464_15155, partial [Myxococcales bacterium]|nr:hypothetical protein [Myxococcales bacterium]
MRAIFATSIAAAIALVACAEPPPAVGEVTQAIVECNQATVGQPCDTDDDVCTREECQVVGPGVACVAIGAAADGTACGSDGVPCTLDACQAGACV